MTAHQNEKIIAGTCALSVTAQVTVIRNDCGEKMMCDAARKACIALDFSDENDPDRKQDLATSLKVRLMT